MDTPVGPPASDFTAIKGVQSYTNFFVGVQGEPGRGKYFDFDSVSYENNVFGHDNFPHGSQSQDPALLYLNSGGVGQLGELNTGKLSATSVTCAAVSGAHLTTALRKAAANALLCAGRRRRICARRSWTRAQRQSKRTQASWHPCVLSLKSCAPRLRGWARWWRRLLRSMASDANATRTCGPPPDFLVLGFSWNATLRVDSRAHHIMPWAPG